MNKNLEVLWVTKTHTNTPRAGDYVAVSEDQIRDFAEGIVKECAKICVEQNVSNIDLDVVFESGKFTLLDLATRSCGNNLSKQIKKHFGVEE